MQTVSDTALAAQVAVTGNQQAFEVLVRRYQSAVRRLLLSLTLGNETLADDLAQETFIKAYTHIGQFRALSSFQTWLFRIAYRVFYDYRRSVVARESHREDLSGLPAAATAASPDGTVSLHIDLYQSLAQLKDEERTCVTLQLIDGESLDHIAEITGMNVNTVKSHLHRGKEKLANYLRRNGYGR